MNNDHTVKSPKVMFCPCEHEYQDKRYGKNNRLHNPKKEGKYGCTVCGKVKDK